MKEGQRKRKEQRKSTRKGTEKDKKRRKHTKVEEAEMKTNSVLSTADLMEEVLMVCAGSS